MPVQLPGRPVVQAFGRHCAGAGQVSRLPSVVTVQRMMDSASTLAPAPALLLNSSEASGAQPASDSSITN